MTAIDAGTLHRLREAAAAAAHHAYAPYSKFRVGAALLFSDGTMYAGCNVENMSFGLSNCAERSALFRSVSERGAGARIVAIAVTNLNDAPSPPCGACLQVMSEFTAADAVVSFTGEQGWETHPFSEVFPFGFRLEGK
ncbi:cytidine deaminase [Paracidobacterium acidisoli]|uniref:Cytidine deaminase n=1 Tax=Paracidobacterium acidisoli TaxID=2303751 RepID=A0A372IQ43_9BACT|nr:cytidine deaminase [Paracidobacterium acidisoli]MBT9331356.1 cytidine deaminase [Paracidobacterium acidisoli]